MINKLNAAVGALMPSVVAGASMSFPLNGGVCMPTTSADDDSSSNDDTPSDSSNDDNQPADAPIAKRTRRVHQRRPMNSSTWWTYFVSPEANAQLLDEPDGKLAKQFRQAFRLSYLSFRVKIFDFAVKTWWPDWEEYRVDAFGRPVGYLELKLLGCLNV